MRPKILALSMAMLVLAACAQQNEHAVRGVLNDHGGITLAECGSGKVYWVRSAGVLASSLMGNIRDLSGDNGAGVVGELRGEKIDVRTSVGAAYPVHGTLWMSQIISVERGEC